MSFKQSPVLNLVGLIAAMNFWACAQERDLINRVQPYALDKAFFVGNDLQNPNDNPEFYTQGTLVDVGYGAAQSGLFTSTYAQPMSRIKWQITEDLLLGRLSYERIENSDGKGVGNHTNEGVIAVAFKIEKHFDIVREYNPTTGEELNVLEENTTDRPWYERQYMRVDWSKNLNTDSYDFDTLSLLGVIGGVKYESLDLDVTDPNDPNAPFFDLENGYFDLTNKAYAKPQVVDLSSFGWGIDNYPACYLPAEFSGGSYPSGSCSPIELTIRHSFRKVVDTDYEPVNWDGYRFQAYGGFYVERFGYSRNYGMSDAQWHRFLTRYNIWDRSHYYDNPETMEGPAECFTPRTTPFGADPHRDFNGNGTEDECEQVGSGSRCDTFRQRCTLPYTQRTTKVIPWYYTNSNYQDFFDATEMATHEWDVALRVAVRTAQYAECKSTGGQDCMSKYPIYTGQQDDNHAAIILAREVDACRAQKAYQGQDCNTLADQLGAKLGFSEGVISIAKMPEMVVLCHSPVQADDHQACGDARLPAGITAQDCSQARETGNENLIQVCDSALNVRQGDLRYHQVNIHDKPQTPSPWGIYTDAEDPLTGETISASINTWAHVNDLFSQQVIDKLRFIKGELKAENITEGKYVLDWDQAAMAAGKKGVAPMLDKKSLESRLFGMQTSLTQSDQHAGHNHALAPDPSVMAQARALRQELTGVAATLKAPSVNSATYHARSQHASGSSFEAQLLTPMVQMLTGIVGLPITEQILDIASPLRGGNPSFQREFNQLKENALAKRGACILHPSESLAPISLTGLANVLEEKFGKFNPQDSPQVQLQRAERMRQFVSKRAQYSVIVHEMGHSVGLRHNFISSSDAWSYRPQYWQLRTKNGQVTEACTDLSENGEDCVGPRYFDPVTDEEQNNLIWMFMHSSVMDYPGEVTQDFMGLGAYDFAAARMFYGDMVAVFDDPNFKVKTHNSYSMIAKMDNFGGILGIQPSEMVSNQLQNYHYSLLQKKLGLISDCHAVDVLDYKPALWNEAEKGTWNPLLDGLFVKVNGRWTTCKQQKVDYMPWNSLRKPTEAEFPSYTRSGPSIDPSGRLRLPYGFATDSWADLGNLSVYRHDNGADAYEIFNFFITQQEVDHIFDYYRRGRQSFSIRKAADRTLQRYNAKLRDGAKGLGLMRNVYQDFALELGYDFSSLWPYIAGKFFVDNVLASSMAFDHFSRLLSRPEIGPHFLPESFEEDPSRKVLRSERDTYGPETENRSKIVIHNGASGRYGNIWLGGKAIENQLSDNHGEYDREYTINAGSYYEKLSTAMLMTESVDNFISDSRTDFTDPRYRAVSLADLFPNGYRRFLANNLTDDDYIKGPRVATDSDQSPLVDANLNLTYPLGWISWWGETPQVCFPAEQTTVCSSYAGPDGTSLDPYVPAHTMAIDPQVGWEQQKFLIAWTLLYLPENEKTYWLDMLRLWQLGADADPGIDNRIEFHDPTGQVFVAKTFGKETIFGKEVQRGPAARVLEYANELLMYAYVTEEGPDLDMDGKPDWLIPVLDSSTGRPIVRYDPTMVDMDGYDPDCSWEDNSGCECSSNRFCVKLQRYVSVPAYLREAISAYGLGDPDERGVY